MVAIGGEEAVQSGLVRGQMGRALREILGGKKPRVQAKQGGREHGGKIVGRVTSD